MPKVKLTFACGLYDRVLPLYTGAVPVEGVDLNFVNIDSPREIFDRMSASQEFDASEYSSSEFISRYSAKQCPFVAIPVFPSRSFRHGFIAVNRKLVKTAKDLEGGRIGLPMYTMTASIFIKGLLAHECGVDLSNVTWVEGQINGGDRHGNPVTMPLVKPVAIERNQSGKSLSDLLEEASCTPSSAPRCRARSAAIRISCGSIPTTTRPKKSIFCARVFSPSCISWRSAATSTRSIHSLRPASAGRW